MPQVWEHPDALFEVNLPVSQSKTVNLCHDIARNANLLYDEYRGDRIPLYMKNHNELFPNIGATYGRGPKPADGVHLER